ncbi:hypothetical protein [Pseudomonas putida]|uniref:hypothetical protein n=1 Tax=Pseudomonas putida TaxID=303 RepID=UPI001CD6CAD5|nr:hypothetical protein [Pseudomonas putida]
MLVQPKKKISAPHSLRDPVVPGRLLPSGQWGINRAAALLTFPDDGLQVVIPVWANKAVGDTAKLLLNGREVDGRSIIDEAELKQPTLLWVAPRHLQTGPYQLTYEIKQLNQKEERPDKPLNLFVKLELPGGQDIDPGPGHSNLFMYIPPEIVNGGVDKDIAEAGVPIVIRSESGSGLPYPDIAEGDVIHLSWGGFFEYSTPVTQAQINDPAANPILITVSKATIKEAGDTDLFGLAVTFKVRDIVDNESEDWCKETRIVVTTGIDLLAAPIVQEAVNNKLDADKQGDNDITVHVTADRPDFEMNDIIHLTMLGTTLEGEKVEVTALPQTVDNIPHNYEFKLSIAAVRKLVNTQVSFFYRLERSGSSDPLGSKRQFVQVTGAAHRLAAPIIEEAEGEFIDPTKTPINVRIPFDPAIEYGMGIELFLLGKSPDGSTFLPELEWHIPEEDEVENPEGFVITVDDYNLKLLDGGTLKGWYDLLIAEGDEILRRESLHTKLLNVGEPKFELDAPIVLGVQNGFLDPATLPGGSSKLTIPRPVVKPWVANDEATWKWVGDISGEEPGSRTFNAVTAQQDWVINLDAAFVAQHIEPNRGSKITVRYQLWRNATDETSLSNPLVFTVGVALELLAPSIKENNGDSALNPLLVRDTLTIVVPDNSALLPTDEIITTWTGAQGTPAGGSHTSVPRPLGSNREFAIPNSVVAFNLNKDVKVSYVVIRDGKPLPSLVFDLTVLSMPQNELLKPIIKDADNNGEGPEFNVGNLTTNATYRMGVWPLIATGQYVWLRLKGTNADGSDYNLQIHTAPGSMVSAQWINQGYYERSIAFAGLRNLKDGSTLRMEFKAAFGKEPNESLAVAFPVRTYTVVTRGDLDLEQPTIKENNGDSALNPLLVRDTLTIVVPDNSALLPNHEISVTWTGADGTPAGGSHTSVPRAVSEGLEFAIPNSVVAFNLGKQVKISYVVIIDGHPTPSREFDLTVQAMPQSALASPTIEQADNNGAGPELHTGNLTQSSVRMGDWPLIALNQYVWLRLRGTKADGSAYVREIWSAPTAGTNPDWIADRFFTVSLPVDELKALQDGSGLALVFKAALGQSTVESEAVEFPARTYTIKAALALVINTEPVSLGGWIFRSDHTPTNPPGGSFVDRQASGGVPPYQYSSSNSAAAEVNITNGRVISKGNGTAVITVRDSANQTVSYPVSVSNVYRIFGTGAFNTYTQCSNAAANQGGRIPSLAEWHSYISTYAGLATESAWCWAADSAGTGKRWAIYPATGETKALRDLGFGGDTANGYGIR